MFLNYKIFPKWKKYYRRISKQYSFKIILNPLSHRIIFKVSRALLDGKISAQDLIKSSLKQIDKTKDFNAFITVTHRVAEDSAECSSFNYKMKKPRSILEGIPIAIKDNFCTKDVKTTCGSKMLEKFIPPYNATVCQRLFDAGAILVGKTNLDEFAMGSGTVDSIFGVTKDIWGFTESTTDFYISGGSSGGSAVAVATGSCYGLEDKHISF